MAAVVDSLRESIHSQLDSLIDRDYVLLDLPYHANIGDVLIWEGELSYLRTLPYKCLNSASCRWSGEINKDTIILLHGGGNFGDLYRVYQEFRLKIIQEHPNNKIIIFPQSVCYQNKQLVEMDSQIMSRHNNLYICARDIPTFNFMKENFPQNNILLVPDMAFHISDHLLNQIHDGETSKSLYLSRLDKERDSSITVNNNNCDVHDWPTCERLDLLVTLLILLDKFRGLITHKKLHSMMSSLVDSFAINVFRPYMVKKGLHFIQRYDVVITTRLHALISSVLLNKKVFYIDNISGKLSAYVDTWLTKYEKVSKFNDV